MLFLQFFTAMAFPQDVSAHPDPLSQALEHAHTLLDTQLTCFKCDEPFHNVPKLKAHLLEEFEKEKKNESRRVAKYGRARSEEGEMF